MRVQVSDPGIAPEIVSFVRRMGFVAHPDGDHAMWVSHPGGVVDEVARLELDLYLSLWRAANDEYSVSITVDST